MRRRSFLIPAVMLVLSVALTMGIAAAGAPPYPPDLPSGGGESADRSARADNGELILCRPDTVPLSLACRLMIEEHE